LRIVLSRRSTVDPSEIVKHLSEKCPGVTLTTNEKDSDFMLNAWGWSGNYRFMVIGHGGAHALRHRHGSSEQRREGRLQVPDRPGRPRRAGELTNASRGCRLFFGCPILVV
jgi:hypothetical protein